MTAIELSKEQVHEFQMKFLAEAKMVVSNQFDQMTVNEVLKSIILQRMQNTMEPCVALHILAYIKDEIEDLTEIQLKVIDEIHPLLVEETLYAAAIYYLRKPKVDPLNN